MWITFVLKLVTLRLYSYKWQLWVLVTWKRNCLQNKLISKIVSAIRIDNRFKQLTSIRYQRDGQTDIVKKENNRKIVRERQGAFISVLSIFNNINRYFLTSSFLMAFISLLISNNNKPQREKANIACIYRSHRLCNREFWLKSLEPLNVWIIQITFGVRYPNLIFSTHSLHILRSL